MEKSSGVVQLREAAFRQLMWGSLFVFFSFRIQGVDILPDVVGYILFLIGLSNLANDHDSFRTAYWLCFPLIFLSVFEIYQPTQPSNGGGFHVDHPNPLFMVVQFVDWLLLFVLVYHLCKGIQDLSLQKGLISLAETARSRWSLFVICQLAAVAAMLLVIVGILLPMLLPLLFLLIIAGLILGIVMVVLFMQLFSKCAQEL